ncbi:hypothetical protein [Myxococcus sp. RHSTA-1-4]|uniref:hypothetical protein n=1 Tax=Myxococcus sp. RHSTA-1-4 TaxID=2874601 RepID=UPI001CBB197A|nr:hypothetical protein [Myxococcus sp. RHSTA-1-4]MBZ4421315.1 hypothetical protein [Myxococcus sp. RHSTA-1-4]
MKRVSALCAVLMSVLFTGAAHAAPTTVNGYICSATYTRQNNVFYGQGYVQVQVYAGQGCSGAFVGTYQYLGSGASNTGYQHSEAERLELFRQATEAATLGTRVSIYHESVGGGIFQTTYFAN